MYGTAAPCKCGNDRLESGRSESYPPARRAERRANHFVKAN